FLSFPYHTHHRPLHSFPTRRSSDLTGRLRAGNERSSEDIKSSERDVVLRAARRLRGRPQVSSAHSANSNHLPRHRTRSAAGSSGDRKSTRLNSSHVAISYAVFCLKK